MASWADRARLNSPKPSVAQAAVAVPTMASITPGTGMSNAAVGQLTVDAWTVVMSYCEYAIVLRISRTCATMRRLALRKSLWSDIQDSFTLQFEMDVGHEVPTIEFNLPAEMSSVVTGSNVSRSVSITRDNEHAAEFIRYSRYLSKSEHRLWHLKEVKNSLPQIVNGHLRIGWVTSYDATQPAAAFALPITIVAADRNGPFIKPSEISTVFSHIAANAVAVCRINTLDVTSSYSSLFLQRVGRALGTSTLHRDLGKILVSVALIELSRPEAIQCVESFYPSGGTSYPASMFFSDVTIDDNETKYFAVRQLSTESHIGVLFVDPIVVLGLCVGRPS